MKPLRRSLSHHPLAACLSLLLGAPDAGAVSPHATAVVQNCLDHGAGSLRQAIIDDTTNEPIDLRQLACSAITLTTGSINVQGALLIRGPGAGALTIDGALLDRVFSQTSSGVFALYGMTIQNGYATSFGGGCIYAAGSLVLTDTVIKNCHVSATGGGATAGGGVLVRGDFVATDSSFIGNENYSLGNAFGGGVSVNGAAALFHSSISGNRVSNGGGIAAAGGIEVGGALTMLYSTVSDNRASGVPGSPGSVGAIRTFNGATITQSTISGNSADGGIGGLRLYAMLTPNTITDSTISGNSGGAVGGLEVSGNTSIRNSTIAFNVETVSHNGGGLRITNSFADVQSSIIAANMSGGGVTQNIGLGISASISGANNLFGPSPSVTLPADTIGGDPKLFPLHDNGGPTKTHALRPGSPAVNAGNVVSGSTTDQRGTGFPRIVGGVADVGAFEGIDSDSIFFNAFD